MQNVIKSTKKVFTAAVVALTIAWSVSLSAFLAPLAAQAAVSGSLVKASLPAVYYVGQDGKRYVFPNEKTYKTWYADFSSVITISDAELASMMIGGNVTYKPGVMMVKITTDPKVYVVDAHGVLRPIASEAVAAALYGANWNQQIHDVPDAFFTNYSVGSAVNSASDFNPAAASAAATSVNVDKGLGNGSTAAGLSVSRASDSPAGASLPQGATGVNYLKVNVYNGSSSASVLSSATFHRSGVGSSSDFAQVYLYKGSERLTTGRSINSSSNTVTFSGLNVSIPAGGTASLWIAADMCDDNDLCTGSAGVGNSNSLELTELLVGGSAVSGTPIMGSSFSIAGAPVGEITIDNSGSTLANVKAGARAAKVASFTLQASGNEDLDLRSIALTLEESVNRGDLSNFVLKQAGLTLATTPSLSDKDLAVFELSSPMFLEEGSTRTFDVLADVNGAVRTDDIISFYVDEKTDVHATGRTYGHGVLVMNSFLINEQHADIDAGNFTIAFNGPSAHDIAQGGSDVEVYNFSLTSAASVEVRNVRFVINCDDGGSQNDYDDFRLIDTASGALLGGPRDLANCGDGMVFNETFTIAAGQTRTIKMTVDVDDVATPSNSLTVTMNPFQGSDVRNLDSGRNLVPADDMVPNTAIGGNPMTTIQPYLDLDNSSNPVGQTYIKGSQNVALGGWTFQASDAAAITINSLRLETTSSTTANVLVQTVKLWNGATQVGNTESLDNSGVVTFDGLNIVVPAGQTLTLMLSGNLGTSFSGGHWVRFSLNNGDVEATEEDGNNATVNGGTAFANQMNIDDNGTVAVVRAPSDVETEAGLVIGSANNVVLGKWKFTATSEALKVVKLRFSISNEETVTSLSLYDGATLVGGPASVNSSGEASFTNMNVAIAKDGNKTLTLKANMASVGNSGAMTGTSATATLLGNNFEVRGSSAGSSTVITLFDGDNDVDTTPELADFIVGYDKVLRKTKPTVSLSATNTVLTNGSVNAFRFTVTADTAGDVSFAGLEFTVTSGGGVINGCSGSESSIRKVGDGTDIDGTCSGTGTMTVLFGEEQVVAAGSSKTYDLRMLISNVLDGDDTVSTLLKSDNFLWSDNSDTAHDASATGGYTSNDWINGGVYVKVLPTDTVTLQD